MPDENWFVLRNGRPLGPFSDTVLRAMITAGQVRPADPVRPESETAWLPATERFEFENSENEQTAERVSYPAPPPIPASEDSGPDLIPGSEDAETFSEASLLRKQRRKAVREINGRIDRQRAVVAGLVFVSTLIAAAMLLSKLFDSDVRRIQQVNFLRIFGPFMIAGYAAERADRAIDRIINLVREREQADS